MDTAEGVREVDVVIVGAGASGIGLGALLKQIGLEHVVIEAKRVGESFLTWPKETRFISPSFTGNFFGAVDLNAVTPDSSPAYAMSTQHPNGEQYAKYLNGVREHFKIETLTNTRVLDIDAPAADDADAVEELPKLFRCIDDTGITFRTDPDLEKRVDPEGTRMDADAAVLPGQVVEAVQGPLAAGGLQWIRVREHRWVPLALEDGAPLFQELTSEEQLAMAKCKPNAITVRTDGPTFKATFVVWAAGEFQYPKSIPHTVRSINHASYTKFPVGKHVIIGGNESGMDAAYHLARLGSEVTVCDANAPWAKKYSDSSYGLSPATLDRVREMKEGGRVTFVDERATEITATEVVTKSHRFALDHPALDATGFNMKESLAGKLFKFDDEGCATTPVVTKVDESSTTPNVFLAGPNLKHGAAVFCFIYKYRQRWAVVAREMLRRLGRESPVIEQYKSKGFLMDDLSCCGDECAC